MSKALIIFAAFSILLLSVPLPSEAIWFGGQNFETPLENETIYKGTVNKYFHLVRSHALTGTLLKAGFFLALFIMIVKIGFGQGREGLGEFLKYVFTILLLVAPIFGGQSLPILIANTSDRITYNIVADIGAPAPKTAGGGVLLHMAFDNAREKAIKEHSKELATFRENCYSPAVQAYQLANQDKKAPKPSDVGNLNYSNIIVDPAMAFFDMLKEDVLTTDYDCAQYKDYIAAKLKTRYDGIIDDHVKAAQANGTSLEKIEKPLSFVKNVTGDEILDEGTFSASAEAGKSWTQKIKDVWNTFTLQPGSGVLSLLMVFTKAAIMFLGLSFLWFFDYHIYEVCTVIKTVAAMALVLGVLYYMFLKKLELPIGALGLWAFANGLYLIAGVTVKTFYYDKMTEVGLFSASALGYLLGFKTIVGDALVATAFAGMSATILAGYLSWTGAKVAMNFVAVGSPKGSSSSPKNPSPSPPQKSQK